MRPYPRRRRRPRLPRWLNYLLIAVILAGILAGAAIAWWGVIHFISGIAAAFN